MKLWESWIWPKVDSRRNARFAVEEAFWIASFVSVVLAVLQIIDLLRPSESEVNYDGFVAAVIYAAVALGVRQNSRLAAVAGLALFVGSRLYLFVQSGPKGVILTVLGTLAF